MKRFLVGFLAVAMGVACTLALPGSVAAQFPFPVAHYSVVDDGGTGSDAGCCATEFDGSTQYLHHTDNTGWSDSNQVTLSLWFKRGRDGMAERVVGHNLNNATRFAVSIQADDTIQIFGANASGAAVLNVAGSSTMNDTDWHHLLFSCDLSDTNNRHFYVDDVPESPTWTTYDTSGTVDLTVDNYTVAVRQGQGDLHFDGALSEIWIDADAYVDFSVEANRRDFVDENVLPVDLASDGSGPTGSAPEVYLDDVGGTNTGTTSNYSAFGGPTTVAGPNP